MKAGERRLHLMRVINARRGLGVYGVLRSLEMMRGRQREYLYLGYFIAACRKMAYKAVFRPQERFLAGRWQEFAG